MNRLPVDLKKIIAGFFFFNDQPYNSMLPADAVTKACSDLKSLLGLHCMCTGDDTFLDGKFCSTKTRDRDALMQSRKNLVRAIMLFKHANVRNFVLPLLKTRRRCIVGFVYVLQNTHDIFVDKTFALYDARVTEVDDLMESLRRKQRVLLRRSHR